MDLFTIITVIAVGIASVAYLYSKYYLSYWSSRQIPSIRTFGKFLDIFLYRKCPAKAFEEIYCDAKTRNEPVVGINVFHRPALVVKDLELVKTVLIKDFNLFQDRFSATDIHKDLLGSNTLFFKRNPQWKMFRANLTPMFSSSKLKQMFSLSNEIGKELDKHICSLTANDSKTTVQEVRNMAQLFTIDAIASVAFGIDAHSISNPEADFLKLGRDLFTFNRWRSFEFSSFFFLPDIISLLNLKLFTKGGADFVINTLRHTMNEREKSNTLRNDVIDALLVLQRKQKTETDPSKKLDEIALVAQAATFFIAGFEASSTSLSFAFWEILRNPKIQKRLREEIREALKQNNGELTYDVIQNMEYLNMVIQETLRLYPILPFLDRQYESSDGKDYSMEPITSATIKNGTPVYIPVFSIQRDEKYFENPNVFDPERFSQANKDKIVPYSYIPFGVGPRNCIGDRFGSMQTKIGLVYFLKSHRIEVCDQTLKEMKLEKKALLLQSDGGVYCKLVRDPLYV